MTGPPKRAEAEILMKVQEHILSPRFGGPVMGGIHDYISGAFLLTHKDSAFNKSEALQILSYISFRDKLPKPIRVDKDGTEWWSGKQLVSLVLPKDLHMEYKASICTETDVDKKGNDPDDSYVIIRAGQLVAGTIDEKSVGAFKGKLIDHIVRRYGTTRGARFIDEVTRLAVGAIMIRGFSTSIDDEDIPMEARKQIAALLEDVEKEVDKRVQAFLDGTLNQLPGRSLEETLEVEVMRELGRARDEAGQIAGRHLGLENSAVIMARSGARGSMLNLSQMAGCIGQQAVRGERIKRGYRGRTLPHFKVGALGAGAKGFVESSYKSGLNPTEYFFHAMGGREGLVDTAVRTSRSGYMQRRLINALEDIKIMYDGTVRNTAGTIIQFVYGEDGIDPSRSTQGKAIDLDDIIRETIGYEEDYDFEAMDKDFLGFSEYEDLKIEPEDPDFEPEEVE
jgi:DNA-directed RNA polymerase subunit A'